MAAAGATRADGMTAPQNEAGGVEARGWFAWAVLALGAWLFASLIGVSLALDRRLTTDVTLSPYHIPFYLGVLAVVGLSIVRIGRARRHGAGWREAFPVGYDSLGAAALLFLAWPIIDVGWREGIGVNDSGIERLAAPSRLVIFMALVLVAAAPLRAALRSRPAASPWQAAISGALTFAVVGAYGGLAPAANLWMERPLVGHEDDTEIWVMAADGSNQTRLLESDGAHVFSDAVWSPDGSQFAYTQARRPERGGGPVPDVDIWVAAADGSDRRQLVGGEGWQWLPQWSPDGQWVVYTVDPPGGPGGAGLSGPDSGFGQGPAVGPQARVVLAVDIWRIRADESGAPEQLTDDPGDDRAGVYSPDGRRLLFDSTREGGSPALYVMTADAADVVRATALGDSWGGAWSPDGSRIAFNSWREEYGGEELFIVGWPDLGEPVRLTTTVEFEVTPSWSPDGTRLAFATDRDGHRDIWSIAVDGSDPINLTRTLGPLEWLHAGGGAWGPDGRILYARAEPPAPEETGIVREDLGVAGVLVQAILAAIIVLLVVAAGAPFGAIAMVLGLQTLVAVVENGEWRFVLAAVAVGLVLDVLVRLAPARSRSAVAGAGAAAAIVLAPGLTVLVTSGLGWSVTLLLGVALAAAAIGAGLSGVVGRTVASGAGAADG